MNLFTAKWPFYISGPLFALLIVTSLYVFNEPVGMSDAMTVAGEYCNEAIVDQELDRPPPLDWQLGLLLGLFVGALVAALIGNKYQPELVAPGAGSFTLKALKTVGGGIAGGFLVMLGIQLSGDTLLGQLAAAVQLSGGAWIFLMSLAISGGTLAILIERRGEGGGKKAAGRAAGKTKDKA